MDNYRHQPIFYAMLLEPHYPYGPSGSDKRPTLVHFAKILSENYRFLHFPNDCIHVELHNIMMGAQQVLDCIHIETSLRGGLRSRSTTMLGPTHTALRKLSMGISKWSTVYGMEFDDPDNIEQIDECEGLHEVMDATTDDGSDELIFPTIDEKWVRGCGHMYDMRNRVKSAATSLIRINGLFKSHNNLYALFRYMKLIVQLVLYDLDIDVSIY